MLNKCPLYFDVLAETMSALFRLESGLDLGRMLSLATITHQNGAYFIPLFAKGSLQVIGGCGEFIREIDLT